MRRKPAILALACVAAIAGRVGIADGALCGDTSGNGFFSASDALQTLTLAVHSGYDRRGDVWPPSDGDDRITASDALESLMKAVAGVVPPCRGARATRAIVSTAPIDFSSGGFAVVDIATRAFSFRLGALSPDSVVRTPSGTPIIVNRRRYNSLQFLDVNAPTLPNIKDCSVADGINSNPQDVVLVSPHKGYVTPYASGSLYVIDPAVLFDPGVDPACDGIITDHVDLSTFDSDGVPEVDQMAVVGGNLFVSMQLLDTQHQPTHGPARIAVIDTATDQVKTSIALSFANPFAATKGLPYDEFQNRIFVGGPGTIGSSLEDGAIEAIDPTSMQSAGVLLTGADVAANIFDFVIVGTDRAFAIIADDKSNSVVDVQLSTRSIRKVLLSSTALITDIEMTELGELWVAYRGESKSDRAGIRIFSVMGDDPELTTTDDAQPTPKPIALGQAPFTLAFIP